MTERRSYENKSPKIFYVTTPHGLPDNYGKPTSKDCADALRRGLAEDSRNMEDDKCYYSSQLKDINLTPTHKHK